MVKEKTNEIFTHRSLILVDNSIERSQYSSYIRQSKAGFNVSDRTVEFDISASDSYYDPSESFRKVEGKLVRGDNENAYAANTQIENHFNSFN